MVTHDLLPPLRGFKCFVVPHQTLPVSVFEVVIIQYLDGPTGPTLWGRKTWSGVVDDVELRGQFDGEDPLGGQDGPGQ